MSAKDAIMSAHERDYEREWRGHGCQGRDDERKDATKSLMAAT